MWKSADREETQREKYRMRDKGMKKERGCV